MIRPQRGRFLDVARPAISDDELGELADVLRSGWLTSGPRVERLQERLAEYLDAPFVRCLSSCTAGLTLALRLIGVGPGDEVLVPANTFAACANVVEHAGAAVVFVDSDPRTGLLDLDHAEQLIGPRTSALMIVHLGGRPVDMDAVARLRDRHGIAIVEDAAHAIGARWRGRAIGAWGNRCAFSFHATKNMTTADGGALVVGSEPEARRTESLALHGLSRSSWSRHGTATPATYDVHEPGFKLAMNDVAAAIGIHQLARLDGWIERREALARAYDERLAGLPLELSPPLPAHARHARHLYTVLLRPEAGVDRDTAIAALSDRGVGTSVHFRGVHLHRYYRERYALRPEDLPHATDWSARALTLPLHPGMDDADVDTVCDALAGVCADIRKVA